ncbi:MAG: hypothetical protein ACTS22_04825 [Phycisphaerales bacterium]
MIRVLDVWDRCPPPPGGADDEALLRCAEHPRVPTVVIGDATAVQRARAVGIEPVAHIAVRPRSSWMMHRRLARLLQSLGRPECHAASEFAVRFAELSGAIPGHAPQGAAAPLRLTTPPDLAKAAPVVVPIAPHPSGISATHLIEAAGLLAAGGTPVAVVVPVQCAGCSEARRRASAVDRPISIIPTALPAVCWLAHASIAIDWTRGESVQRSLARARGLSLADASQCRSGLSLATTIRSAMRQAAGASA